MLTIFYVGMIMAGTAFQKMTGSDDVQEVARADPVVSLSLYTLVLLPALIALLAVLAGGLPVAVAVVRSAPVRKRAGSLLLLTVPLLANLAPFSGSWCCCQPSIAQGRTPGCCYTGGSSAGGHRQSRCALPGGDP